MPEVFDSRHGNSLTLSASATLARDPFAALSPVATNRDGIFELLGKTVLSVAADVRSDMGEVVAELLGAPVTYNRVTHNRQLSEEHEASGQEAPATETIATRGAFEAIRAAKDSFVANSESELLGGPSRASRSDPVDYATTNLSNFGFTPSQREAADPVAVAASVEAGYPKIGGERSSGPGTLLANDGSNVTATPPPTMGSMPENEGPFSIADFKRTAATVAAAA